jgi:hypothetical protein
MQLLIARGSYPYTSVLKGLNSYTNSAAQARLHKYIRDDDELNAIKKHIDYKTINKNSKGVFMFREFLFQEKVEQNYIAPLNRTYLHERSPLAASGEMDKGGFEKGEN